MALQTRADAFGLRTGIRTEELVRASRLVSRMTGMVVQRNKAIVGANAFAHESGIHQDGMLKHRRTYEIMRPEDVGVPSTTLVLGKHSGRHAVQKRCEQMGAALSRFEIDRVYRQMVALADAHKHVSDAQLRSIVERVKAGEAAGAAGSQPQAARQAPAAVADATTQVAEVGYGHGV